MPMCYRFQKSTEIVMIQDSGCMGLEENGTPRGRRGAQWFSPLSPWVVGTRAHIYHIASQALYIISELTKRSRVYNGSL